MRAPLGWLRESVEISASTKPKHVLDALVRVGLEDEAVHAFDVQGPLVVGEVLSSEPEEQSNGKTINWCQVRVAPEGETAADGGADVRGIVCGAHNFSVGDKVVVCLPGAVLPNNFEITPRKTYGHVSDGMIASERELGLGDDQSGILVLSRKGIDPEVGTDAISLLNLDEQSVEVSVTPDRGYAMSIRGLAREYSHATGAGYSDPAERDGLSEIAAEALAPESNDVRVPISIANEKAVRDEQLCQVFAGLVVSQVNPAAPTPPWMSARLNLSGIRSLSLLVDITNYVMIELGQPIHGYDLDKLQGAIHVRRAAEGEQLQTLDGKERTLSDEDILITDERGPIGLAGVMGGMETELSSETTNVFIEAAGFAPISIARTARRHKLPSEASRRFERGVDPKVALPAAARVAQLMIELAGGTLEPVGSHIQNIEERESLTLELDAPRRIMGIAYDDEEIVGALRAVGCTVWEEAHGVLGVTPPSWRPDLVDTVTLVEEVGRLCDFDRIPSVLPVAPPGRGLTREQRLRRQVSNAFAASGLTEVLSYPFTKKIDNDLFGRPDEEEVTAVTLANALDSETKWLRTSMLPGLLGVAHRNYSRGMTDLAIFETGIVFRPETGVDYGTETVPPTGERPSSVRLDELNAGIPPQPRWVGALLLGDRVSKQPGQPALGYDWQDALSVVEKLGLAVAAEISVRQGSHKAFHPGRCAELTMRDGDETIVVGYAGELHPDVTDKADLPRVVAALDVDLDLVIKLARRHVNVGTLAGFPAATQDLTLVLSATVPAGDVLEAVAEGAGELLEDAHLVDDYRGVGLEEGQKALTFALRFRADDRTLTAAEASEAKEAGVTRASQLFNAKIRA